MLLYQWGVHDDEPFYLDITRQFMVGDGEDDDMSQLSLKFSYKPTAALKKIKNGNLWCDSPKELSKFRKFIEGHPAYKAVSEAKADNVKVHFGGV